MPWEEKGQKQKVPGKRNDNQKITLEENGQPKNYAGERDGNQKITQTPKNCITLKNYYPGGALFFCF